MTLIFLNILYITFQTFLLHLISFYLNITFAKQFFSILLILIFQSSPYCMRKEASEQLSGNDQYEGYAIDLIEEISKILGFNYTFKLVPDGRYGSLNRETKEWDGMVRELLEQRADLAIADLTITYDREQAVDFTMPFMNLGKTTAFFSTIFIFILELLILREGQKTFQEKESYGFSIKF